MKTKYCALVSFLVILMAGCQEDWLDPKPLSIYAPENVYVDKAGMDAVLLTLRKDLRYEYYGTRILLMGEYYSSDLGVSGDIASNTISNFNINVLPTGTGNLNLFIYWNKAYASIRNANVVISRIDAPDWNSESDRNEILGEAYFHRAYWYYRLIHQFGEVPFLSKEYTKPKIDFYTHSRQAILNKIQEDLEFAVQWLPEVVDPGKVNRAAGYHLLTKVYLANSQFDKAVTSSSAVINDGMHSLITDRFGSVSGNSAFNVIWDLHQAENKSISANTEVILVVQDKFGYGDASVTNGIQTMRCWTPWWSRNIYIKDPDGLAGCSDKRWEPQLVALGRGVGFFRTSNYFTYHLWNNCGTDLRHDTDTNWFPPSKLLFNNPSSAYYGQPVDIQYTNPRDTFRTYYGWPYYKLYVKDDIRPYQPRGGNTDWYIFRLAETFLLRAEAYYWKGEMANAAADINEVRLRALAPPITAGEVTIDYILDERARELYVEEPRKTELTRIAYIMAENNKFGYTMANFSDDNYWFDRVVDKNFYNLGIGIIWGKFIHTVSPFHVLWPVPQDEIDSNPGGRINQNIGYSGAETNIAPLTEVTDDQ